MTPVASRTALEEFRRGWLPLLACGVGLGCGLSPIQPYASGIMASALHDAYNWPRSQILTSLMLTPVLLLLLSRGIGRLIDRIGPRKVAIASTAGLGIGQLMLAAFASTKPGFFIAYTAMAAMALGTLPMAYAKLINGWFVTARGTALGLALAFTGISGAFFPFMLTSMIARFTWRGGYLSLALLALVVALPFLLAFLREAPAGEAPAGHGADMHHAEVEKAEVRAVIRSYRFLALGFASFVLSFAVAGLMPNLFPILLDHHMTKPAAAGALSAMAISVTAGRILSGWLLDRLWGPVVATVLILPAAAALALIAAPASTGWMLAAATVTLGLIGGAEFDLVAFMTARYFGQRHFSELYGIQYAAFGVGAGFAPAIYGAINDHAGNFGPAILLSVGFLLLAVVVYYTLGRYPPGFGAHGEVQAAIDADPRLVTVEGILP